MILWPFALFELLVASIMVLSHFDFVGWRITLAMAVGLFGKSLLFNDNFLSVIDVVAALYIFLLMFINGTFFTWLFLVYFLYKILISF